MGTVAGIPNTQQAYKQKSLYDRDYYTWAREQADALKRRDFSTIDWENITEEIEALVRGEESSLRSQYSRIMEHFLQLQYREARETGPVSGWRISVDNARTEIEELLQDSPGLKGQRDELFGEAWERARRRVIKAFVNHATESIQDNSMPLRERKGQAQEWSQVLSQQNPYTRQQVEDSDWMPERIRLAHRPQIRHQPVRQVDLRR